MEEKIYLDLILAQKYEITEHKIYLALSKKAKDENAQILKEIAIDELSHYNILRKYTQTEVKECKSLYWFYIIIAKFLGLTFALKLLESREEKAQAAYSKYQDIFPEFKEIVLDENLHEKRLLSRIDENRVKYIGSIVLGLNDAIVELSGALVGFSISLKNSKYVALVGLITGIAAALSMASSEFLSKKAEGDNEAIKASLFTGLAYILAVILMIFPYLLFSNYKYALILSSIIIVFIIFTFNLFLSVVKDRSFKRVFLEMFFIVVFVSLFSSGIGFLLRKLFNIDI